MTAYRRVTVPQFLVAVGYVLLVWAAVLLCAAPTNGWIIRRFSFTNGWSTPSTDHLFRGYPIPWLEHRQDCVSHVRPFGMPPNSFAPRGTLWLGDRQFVGMNVVVPAAMLVLAMSVPLLWAAEVRHLRGWLRGQQPSLTRASRCLRVAVIAAVGGLAVAQGDVLTDQVEPNNGGISEIPYEHIPENWLWSWQPSNLLGDPWQVWQPRDHLRLVYELRDRRAERYPLSRYDLEKPGARSDRWMARTERTLAGTGLGLFLGGLIFRPWRREVSTA